MQTTSALLSATQHTEFTASIAADYEKVRKRVAARQKKLAFLSIEDARYNKFDGGFGTYHPTPPKKPGVHTLSPSIAELEPYIDWTPFFMTWELAGKYPKILEDEVVGKAATELFADASAMLQELKQEALLTCQGGDG